MRLSLWMFVAALLHAAPALAQNPFNDEARRLAREVAREGGNARGALPLLELWQNADWADPEVTQAELERLSRERRLPPQRRAYVTTLLARFMLYRGDLAGSRRAIGDAGFVTDWRVVGSFDNEGKQGFDREYGPEAERLAAWDPDSRYEGREREITWRRYPSETAQFGYVNFDAIFRPYENVCGYAETFVMSPSAQPLSLWIGAGGAVKVWWNGELVHTDARYRGPSFDRGGVGVSARAGANRVLVKACVSDATWGFFLRVGAADGGIATGLRADASEHRAIATAAGPAARPIQGVLAMLDRAAEGERAPARALEDLARYLAYTSSDDPAERRARELARRAAESEPNVERLHLAATLADERGEVMRFGNRAFELAPQNPKARLLRALVLAGGPTPDAALPILRGITTNDVTGAQAAALHATILARLEMNETARSIVERAGGRAPRSAGWTLRRIEAAEASGRADEAIALRRTLLELRYDHVQNRRALAYDALRRGERDEVLAQIEALDGILPDDTRNMRGLAQFYEGLGMEDEALDMMNRAHTLTPEDATILASLGRLQLRLGQQPSAADSLRNALALQPQDAETRELLEQIEPARERADERWAVSTDDLLARRVERSGYPTTILQELRVNTVFDNGLGSSFVQWAAQAHDQEGARQLRTYSIQFDPDTQRVEIRQARVFRADGSVLEATQTFERQLGEPWYRIYYDTRALVVVFPDLEPGDAVEIQYRTDDVAHRNLFADYYGDLTFLQGFSPIRRFDYVLITPARRRFYFNEPRAQGLEHERTTADGRNIDHFFRTDVDAIRSEQGMPGMTEVAPYLHVSTYRTWEDVGRWWWGLIRDQLQIDDGIRRTVRDLVANAPDERTKVRRIYEWVVRNTRYVGLEFGIHGYKPYRVPLIVQRGFGDCKDKASLLYAMLTEAGVDARIVLVRTRRNGAITDLPASLAVFDHAIAYVPSLDLYLDGTAEDSGTTELPGGDQGVTVLVVGPNDARLTRTPVLPPDRNRRTRTLGARLSADGSAELTVREQITGGEAAGYRHTYQAEGTREERFERSLRGLFPGLVLESQTMSGLDELESDIAIDYRARVPDFAATDEGGLRLNPAVLDDLLRRLARNPSRRYPLDLGGTSSYIEERTIELPSGFAVSEVPQGGEAASDFGRLSLSFDVNGRTVRARTEFELRRDRVAPNEYSDFRGWVERADALLRQPIVVGGGGR
jgi:tetratricopeptide (TPR) repeat protein